MTVSDLLLGVASTARELEAAQVARIGNRGSVDVITSTGVEQRGCTLLETSNGPPLRLAVGDRVLIWRADAGNDPVVILGRVASTELAVVDPSERPEELVFEAAKTIVLKCGASSVTLRHDGKVLIKGTELVSHAHRLNRIKGGSVAIN